MCRLHSVAVDLQAVHAGLRAIRDDSRM